MRRNTRTQQKKRGPLPLCPINFGPLQNDLLPLFSLSHPRSPALITYTRRYSEKTSRVQLQHYSSGSYSRVPTSSMYIQRARKLSERCTKFFRKRFEIGLKTIRNCSKTVRKPLVTERNPFENCSKTIRNILENCLKEVRKCSKIVRKMFGNLTANCSKNFFIQRLKSPKNFKFCSFFQELLEIYLYSVREL